MGEKQGSCDICEASFASCDYFVNPLELIQEKPLINKLEFA